MTAPALLIAGTAEVIVMWFARGEIDVRAWGWRMLAWLVSVLFALGAARVLRGQGDFTMTLRAMGFARVTYLIELFALFPALAVIARIAAVIVEFIATWLAVCEAHKLRGWRTIALPLVAFLIAALSVVAAYAFLGGLELSYSNVMSVLGILPR